VHGAWHSPYTFTTMVRSQVFHIITQQRHGESILYPSRWNVLGSSVGWGRCDRECMVVRFTTTYAISAYHHERCLLESRSGKVYSIQHYVIKFVSNLWQVGGFPLVLPVSSTNSTDPHWNIVESGVKHHQHNPVDWIRHPITSDQTGIYVSNHR
jgi:hypothetical protein